MLPKSFVVHCKLVQGHDRAKFFCPLHTALLCRIAQPLSYLSWLHKVLLTGRCIALVTTVGSQFSEDSLKALLNRVGSGVTTTSTCVTPNFDMQLNSCVLE